MFLWSEDRWGELQFAHSSLDVPTLLKLCHIGNKLCQILTENRLVLLSYQCLFIPDEDFKTSN